MNKEVFRQALIEKYEKLKDDANSYIANISITMEHLKDSGVDYVTRSELKKRLTHYKKKLETIQSEMHEIENIALIERISLINSKKIS